VMSRKTRSPPCQTVPSNALRRLRTLLSAY
jgi:hypothetical protein